MISVIRIYSNYRSKEHSPGYCLGKIQEMILEGKGIGGGGGGGIPPPPPVPVPDMQLKIPQ